MSITSLIEKRSAMAALDDSWYYPGGVGSFFYGGVGAKTKAGAAVSEFNALQLAVVWCCVKILSEDTASLPLQLFRRRKSGPGKDLARDDDRYHLLHDSPNPEMTAFAFRETLKAHLLTWGNQFAEIEYGKGWIGRNNIVALWPITPHRVKVKRNTNSKKREIYYHISMAGTNLPDVDLPKNKVLHIPGLSYDGLIGYSVIAAAREQIGMGKALDEFGQTYFGNGIHPSIMVTHPGVLKDPVNFRAALNETYEGLGKHHRALLLQENMKAEKLSIPNNEAQFLETHKFTNIDIGSRFFRIPPHMYGEMDKAIKANVEQQAIDYVTKTLRPWLVRSEQAYNMSFLNPDERKEYFWEHNVEGLLRGDIKSRYDAYMIAKSARILTTNEIREIENRNPIEGEDTLDVSPNMIKQDQLNQQKQSVEATA